MEFDRAAYVARLRFNAPHKEIAACHRAYAARLTDLLGVPMIAGTTPHGYSHGQNFPFDHRFGYSWRGVRGPRTDANSVEALMPYKAAGSDYRAKTVAAGWGLTLIRDDDALAWWNPGRTALYLLTGIALNRTRLEQAGARLLYIADPTARSMTWWARARQVRLRGHT